MDSPSRHSTRSSNVFTSEDGSPDRSGGGERQQPPPQSTFPRPPVHAAARAAQIQQQAANILTLMKSRAGITTYKTSWKAYNEWHECRWACKAALAVVASREMVNGREVIRRGWLWGEIEGYTFGDEVDS